jgi:hypothetical protein
MKTQYAEVAMKKSQFRQVDYRSFRFILEAANSQKVRSRGKETYLYDCRNKLIAIMCSAHFDTFGRCRPPSYYIRNGA